MNYVSDEMIAKIVNKYLGSVTGAREAYMNDALYHERIEFMTRFLEIFDLAMEQEGLSANPRLKILERIMMAAPDPAETRKMLQMLKDVRLSPNWDTEGREHVNHWNTWRDS